MMRGNGVTVVAFVILAVLGGTTAVSPIGLVYAQPSEEWSRTFGGSDEDSGLSVQQTADGGYIIAGFTASFGAGGEDVYLVKTDSDGEELWHKTFGGPGVERGFSVQQTADGGYIVAGGTFSFGAGEIDVYLVKTDSDGEELWHKTFGGSGVERVFSVQQTADGGYIIAGLTASFGAGGEDVYLVKTDSDGEELWHKTFGGSDEDCGRSVQQTTDGGYIVAGETYSFGAGGVDVYLVKTDSDGEELWHKTFGGPGDDRVFSVQQTADGGYIIAGLTASFGAGGVNVYLVKTDSDGEELWHKTFGGSGYECGFSVQQTADGGYIIAGDTKSFGAGGVDFYLIKLAPEVEPLAPEEEIPKEEEKKGCIIATATYGSELAPEVQFLRGFRDNTVLNTFAGKSFMTVFNTWYYSFSPGMASSIVTNEALRGLMKILLYPLIGILHLAAITYSIFSFNHELAVVASGLVASSLIGVVYFSPLTTISLIILRRLRGTTTKARSLRLLAFPLFISIILLLLGEISASSIVMMAASAMFVMTMLSTSAITTAMVVIGGLLSSHLDRVEGQKPDRNN